MRQVGLTSLRAFAKTLEGRTLPTHVRGCAFRVEVTSTGLIFTPESTGKPRPQQDKHIGRVLQRFRETGSLRQSKYHDLTVNASYLMVIIAKFLQQEQR